MSKKLSYKIQSKQGLLDEVRAKEELACPGTFEQVKIIRNSKKWVERNLRASSEIQKFKGEVEWGVWEA